MIHTAKAHQHPYDGLVFFAGLLCVISVRVRICFVRRRWFRLFVPLFFTFLSYRINSAGRQTR